MGKEKRSLAMQTEERLIEMIREKNLKPGDKLDNEYRLAEQLQVGRSTIREAIKSLESRNIVTIRRGAGTYVSSREGQATDPLGISLMEMDEELALELLRVRMILEEESAQRAAILATPEDIVRLENQCVRIEKLIKQQVDYSEEDVRFHTMIARCSGNRILMKLIPIIYSSVPLTKEFTHNRFAESTIEHHRRIVNAIKRHDDIGTKNAMIAHLSENRLFIIEEIERKKRLRDLQ